MADPYIKGKVREEVRQLAEQSQLVMREGSEQGRLTSILRSE